MCPWFDSWRNHKASHFRDQLKEINGFLAQLVEQWIENPCVPGSIPGETTKPLFIGWFFLLVFKTC